MMYLGYGLLRLPPVEDELKRGAFMAPFLRGVIGRVGVCCRGVALRGVYGLRESPMQALPKYPIHGSSEGGIHGSPRRPMNGVLR